MNLHITVCWMLLTLVLMDTCFGGNSTQDKTTQYHTGNKTEEKKDVDAKEGSTLRLKCIAETLNITCSGMAEPLNYSIQHSLNRTNDSRAHADACLYYTKHFNNTLTIFVNIIVIYPLKTLSSSGRVLTGDILECLCNISGIKYDKDLILHSNDYKSTIRINVTLHKHENETFPDGVEDVCKNDVMRNQSTLNIMTGSEGTKNVLNKKTFLLSLVGVTGSGFILCAVICVVALWVSCRTRQNIHTNKEDIHPESIKNQCYQEDINLPAADDHVLLQVRPAEEDASTAETAGSKKNVEVLDQQETPEGQEMAGDGEVREVDYACINFSLLQDGCGECQKTEESGETEYAEIQIDTQEKQE